MPFSQIWRGFLIIIYTRLLPGGLVSFHSPSRCYSSKSPCQFTKLPCPAKIHAQNARRKVRSYFFPPFGGGSSLLMWHVSTM